MRRFASDLVPGLLLHRGDLPEPWILPWALSRQHKERLVTLLARALHGSDGPLYCSQVRWVEREILSGARLKLPPSTLLWWHVEALGAPPVATVLRDTKRLWSGMAVYDIQAQTMPQSSGWLGPLKVRLLHAMLDTCRNDATSEAYEDQLSDGLTDLATLPLTPIELLDCAEVLWDGLAQGCDPQDSRALAIGRILAARFPPGPQGHDPADEVVETLLRVAACETLTNMDRDLLIRAGLLERDESAPLALLDTVRIIEVLRQTVLQLVNHRGLRQPLATLAPQLVYAESVGDLLGPVPSGIFHSSVINLTPTLTGQPNTRQPLLKRVARLLGDNQAAEAGQELLLAIREREVSRWAQRDQERAAELLLQVSLVLDPIPQGSFHSAALVKVAVFATAAADLFNLLSDKARRITAVQARGWAAERLRMADQLTDAGTLLERALGEAEDLADRSGQADTLRLLGDLRQRQYEPDAAVVAYEASLAIYNDIQDSLGSANTLRSMGDLFQKNGQFDLARNALEQARSRYQQLGQNPTPESRDAAASILGQAHVQRSLGNLLIRQAHDFSQAIACFETAMKLYQELDNRLGQANTHRSLGDLKLLQDDLPEARVHYELALPLFVQTGNRLGEANTLGSIGRLRYRQGDLAGAQAMYQAAHELYSQIGDRLGQDAMLESLESCKRLRNRPGP